MVPHRHVCVKSMVACTLFRPVSLVVRYLFSCGSKYNADGRYMCRSLEPHKAQVQVMLYTDGNISSSKLVPRSTTVFTLNPSSRTNTRIPIIRFVHLHLRSFINREEPQIAPFFRSACSQRQKLCRIEENVHLVPVPYRITLYHPLVASFSVSRISPQLMPTMASPRPMLTSAMTLGSL